MERIYVPFIRVWGAKVSSVLSTMRLEVALKQNSCLNFCAPYSNEGLIRTLTKKPQNPVPAKRATASRADGGGNQTGLA